MQPDSPLEVFWLVLFCSLLVGLPFVLTAVKLQTLKMRAGAPVGGLGPVQQSKSKVWNINLSEILRMFVNKRK